ncbi:MAG: type IV secretion system DNA-binding domain-containing protein [Candidatus Gracilibacteria bacterium]|jgi:hypothetical protein|nr:type IV secretion system DNA-binding domain-containing protein [Candidatus Gracilibacteria bacterium]
MDFNQITLITGIIITSFIALLILINLVGTQINTKKRKKETWGCIKILPNKLNERNPNVAENIFASIHSFYEEFGFWDRLTGKTQLRSSCEIASHNGQVAFFVRAPIEIISMIEGQFYASYPDIEIYSIDDYTHDLKNSYISAELTFKNPDMIPFKRYIQFEDKSAGVLNDPIAGLTLPLAKLKKAGDIQAIQVIVSPIDSDYFLDRATKCLQILNAGCYKHFFKTKFIKKFMTFGFWARLRATPSLFCLWILRGGSSGAELEDINVEMSRSHDKENEFSASADKITKLTFNTTIRIIAPNQNKTREVIGAFKQFNIPQLNGFTLSGVNKGKKAVQKFQNAETSGQMIMNTEELATLYHLPNTTVNTPNIEWVMSKKLEPPQTLPTEDGITLLGETNFRGQKREFGIREDDRRRHIYIVGKTGMGKSTLLENMIFSDIQAGKGVAVVDPHGDLADAILGFVPSNRTNDVVLFDPSDSDYPVSFNMLECRNQAHRHLIASGVLGVFKKIFADSWGPRLEHILRNTLLALVEAPNTTMLGIMRMLVDPPYRRQVLKQVKDPMVLSFWNDEFGKWEPRQRVEAISPIQNKVGQFLSTSLVRNILGQPKSSIDLRFAMDKGKIIIINLSKGKIGEDNSALLGSMMITKFQLDVMSRADTPEKERRDFYLYVDEFQNFATDSFATILSEARKYRLNLCVANQYLAQMSDEVREAVFGNVGTTVAFQVGFDDAEKLSNQFAEMISPIDIGSLAKYQIYLRLMINGMTSTAFSAGTLPPPEFEDEDGRVDKILKVVRERYSKPREIVEQKIHEWSNNLNKKEND